VDRRREDVSRNNRHAGTATIVMAVLLAPVAVGAEVTPQPKPKAIQLNPLATEGGPVLGGPPETVTMRSGSIVLHAGKNVGRHSTGGNEEVLFVFSGSGEMRLADGTVLQLKPHVIAYCPPDTEHDVFNTGGDPLRYVYLVARAR
jgi:mannose-6-phosphate isomerase-like protein (cupin superfamily)